MSVIYLAAFFLGEYLQWFITHNFYFFHVTIVYYWSYSICMDIRSAYRYYVNNFRHLRWVVLAYGNIAEAPDFGFFSVWHSDSPGVVTLLGNPVPLSYFIFLNRATCVWFTTRLSFDGELVLLSDKILHDNERFCWEGVIGPWSLPKRPVGLYQHSTRRSLLCVMFTRSVGEKCPIRDRMCDDSPRLAVMGTKVSCIRPVNQRIVSVAELVIHCVHVALSLVYVCAPCV